MFLSWGFTFILVVFSDLATFWSLVKTCRSGLPAQSDFQDTHSAHNSTRDFSARPCWVLCVFKGKSQIFKRNPYQDFWSSFSVQFSFACYRAPQIPDNSAASSAQQERSILGFFPVLSAALRQKARRSSGVLPSSQNHTPSWSACCSVSQDICFVYFAQFYCCLCWKG